MTLYAIGWDPKGPLKLGRSLDAEARVAALQAGCPHQLRVIALGTIQRRFYGKAWTSSAIERAIHRRLAERRVRGDWFQVGLDELRALYPKTPGLDGHVDWVEPQEISKGSTS